MLREKPITICKHEGYLSQARPIIIYFKTVSVYDMIDLNSMVFKLTKICSRSYMLSYFERVYDSHNQSVYYL